MYGVWVAWGGMGYHRCMHMHTLYTCIVCVCVCMCVCVFGIIRIRCEGGRASCQLSVDDRNIICLDLGAVLQLWPWDLTLLAVTKC